MIKGKVKGMKGVDSAMILKYGQPCILWEMDDSKTLHFVISHLVVFRQM